ncbi:hydrophobic/amphiphilic exporter-1, HAE1 family [Pseudorhodobacter antarcticus]|uniref:Hydrophobic/amphiphilic exporter-1, HAE1 family n=1 Tax=Pseudorhodobacter antarcticus TaxID=1077947 RepID=A0A1H8MZA0_9RHOB|nr:efflux RND transporter permease subunit [Pseudorhodobacter antarcticus]SEO22687.1 hydrophobic/amphiphilic exporter-1, HAE1 family [Pseudorhodobacter antarcticus]
MAITAQSALASSTALFVRRPILAFVLSAMIILAGLAGLFGAEIRELPDVDRPVITVTTNFSGASPETIDREITAQIEGAAGRVSGVKSISSSSRFGRSRVTIEFGDDANLDVAATDMRDAIGRISNDLPDGADDPQIVKADANAEAVMRVAVTSGSRSAQDLTQFAQDVIEDRLVSIPGVADLQIYGDRDAVFRVDIDQMQLASRGLTLADVRNALRNVAFDAPAGALSSSSQSIVVRTTATVTSPAAFEALTLRDGITLGDVATVTLGPAPGESILRANGQTGLGLGIIRQAQSNTLEISTAVRAVVAELQPLLPADISVFVTSDDAVFINGSINEVVNTLIIAICIVIAIIYLFLRDVRATIIPAVTLPVSLIGTLAAIYLAGFSINILTLLALVLATGMVVDDAIVVLENIVRRRSEGMGPRAAAVLGTQQVFFAVVTTTATLAAVFIPLSFLPGQTGGLFREFGFTLAMAVLLSSVVALTLCPVLASKMLKGHTGGPAPRGPMIWLGDRLAAIYAASLRACLSVPLLVVAVSVAFALVAGLSFGSIRQELTPPEDRSLALMRVTTPQGVSLDYTAGKMREIEDLIAPLRASGEIENVFSIAGTGADNRGFVVMTLAKWGDRARSQQEIVGQLNGMVAGVVGVQAFAIQPNSLGIRGAGRGLSVALTGTNYDRLAESADKIIERMEENPAFGRVTLGYETTQPQLFIAVDRDRASDLGVNIDGLGEALQAVLDGRNVGTVFIDDRSFDIKMVSTADPVNDPGDLERIFVQAGNGQMIPIASFVTLQERAVAPELGRETQMRAVEISASLSPELSLGDAYARVLEIAAEVAPEGQRIIPLAEAATLTDTASGLVIVFAFAIVIVFLVLSAQFESFVSALIIMATVPLGLACAVFALLATGGSLNVYSQIGLVLLIGIMAKNGILIVEFANQLRDQGKSVRDAIFEASTVRLRPVMMTMASTVLGGLPLIYSAGAGAEAREALGWIIVGGLGLATLSTLYLTPVAYLIFARFSKPKAEEEAVLVAEMEAVGRANPAE